MYWYRKYFPLFIHINSGSTSSTPSSTQGAATTTGTGATNTAKSNEPSSEANTVQASRGFIVALGAIVAGFVAMGVLA
jgi:hypothetical protein